MEPAGDRRGAPLGWVAARLLLALAIRLSPWAAIFRGGRALG